MRVVQDFPPIYDEINARFGLDAAPFRPIFAWGQVIFNPHRIKVPLCLLAHETVHGARQGDDVVGWWRRYIDDDDFRYGEELPAHAAEYLALLPRDGASRQQRRHLLTQTVKRLNSPLYRYKQAMPGQTARLDLERMLAHVASARRAG